jgi:hypothetical protein
MRHSGNVSQLSWPERFAVTITPLTGTSATFEVCTWLNIWKAVAIAVDSYHRQNPAAHVYDVTVQSLGRASQNEDGTVSPGKDLVDRYEW